MKQKHQIDSCTNLQRNPDQLFMTIQNEIVMLSIKHEEYLNLNHHASYIWKQLETPFTFDGLTVQLCSVFDVDRKVSINDKLDFITALVEKDIIQIINEKST